MLKLIKIIVMLLFVQVSYAQNLIILMSEQPGTVSTDTIPSQFTFTDVTDAALSSYHQAYIVVAGCDSARFYPASGDSLKLGALGTYDVSPIWADAGDSIYTGLVASGTNATSTHSIIYSSNGTPYDTFTVTTVAAASYPANLDSSSTQLWVEFEDSVTTSGSEVTEWGDKSISNHDLLPESGTQQPELTADGIKIHPDNQGSLRDNFTLTQPLTVYFVFRVDSLTSPYIFDGYSVETSLFYTQNGTDYKIFGGSGGSATDTLSVGSWYLVTAVFNGANSYYQINNRTAITGSYGTASPNGFSIGDNNAGIYGKFTVKAAIVRNIADSETTRNSIKSYLNDKYSIY